jgi:hypothetical protein
MVVYFSIVFPSHPLCAKPPGDASELRHGGWSATMAVMNQSPQSAADLLNPTWPFDQKSFPPDVWETARKCAEPQRFLKTWLELEVNKKNLQLRQGHFVKEHWESLKQAGYTPKQLEDIAFAESSGEGFNRVMREAFIEELPPKFRGTARNLKRDTSLWRLPLDWLALNDAKLKIEATKKELPVKNAVNVPEFLPDMKGRIESFHKWKTLPAEHATIEASRDAALEKIFSQSQGKSDKLTEFSMLRYGDFLLPGVGFNDSEKMLMRKAVDTSDVNYLTRLGDALKMAKAKSKTANADFKKQIERHRLALFLVEHWQSSPRLRGTWLYLYLNNPQFFNKAGAYLSPRWLGSGALPFLLQPEPANRKKSPELCFFSLEALAKVCGFFLKSDMKGIKRSAVAKMIKRLGLKQCADTKLLITRVEQCKNSKGNLFVS